MADDSHPHYVPLDVPLPVTPSDQAFSDLQWKTLFSIADTVIPSIRARDHVSGSAVSDKLVPVSQLNHAVSTLAKRIADNGSYSTDTAAATELARRYLEENGSSNPAFRALVERTFALYVYQEGKNGLSLILNLLNTRVGSLLLTGSPIPIQDQPFDVRERVFRSWQTASLPPLRTAYRAFSLIFKKTWAATSPTLCPVIGFPRVPINSKPALGFEFEFLQIPPGSEPEVIETDVVVIGSGCGGGIAAKNLAEAGHRVLVVEKSYHYPSKYFPMGLSEGFTNMFEGGASIVADDGSIAVLAGSTWGGGGTVNWSASLQTQSFVRQEWAESGLPFFTSSAFQESLDRIWELLGVDSDHIQHSTGNRVILEGARKLGFAAKAVPQNTGNVEHDCPLCTMGCVGCQKKGPAASTLVDAAKAGAVFMEGFHADRVLFKKGSNGQVASGVVGTWTSRDAYLGSTGTNTVKRKVIIKASTVIVACGSLQSPLLLLRSRIKNPQIGRNLYLHPVILAAAVFDEKTHPWQGSALTTVVNSFENLDGHGHGAKIEAPAMVPSMLLPTFPWRDGLDFKLFSSKMDHMSTFITLARDKHPGRVYPDPDDGRVRVTYTPSIFDRRHIVEALVACAQIAYVSGAHEFHTTYGEMPPFVRAQDDSGEDGINDAALQAWIAELRGKSPLKVEQSMFASAHQMGTCRMGVSARKSVVDPNCRVWGTRGLYVMDASVFPSASGVNPMITNLAIADWASRNLEQSTARL